MKAALIVRRGLRPFVTTSKSAVAWFKIHPGESLAITVGVSIILLPFAVGFWALNAIGYEELQKDQQTVAVFTFTLAALVAGGFALYVTVRVRDWGRDGFPIRGLREWQVSHSEKRQAIRALAKFSAQQNKDSELRAMREQYVELGERLAQKQGLNPLRATLQAHAALDELLAPLERSKV